MNKISWSDIKTACTPRGGDLYLHVPSGDIYIVSASRGVLTSLSDGSIWAHDDVFGGQDDEFEKLLPGTQLTLTVKERT